MRLFSSDSDSDRAWVPVAALAVGVLGMSTSSVLIRLADAEPLAVGAWRLALATLILSPLGLPRLRRERACLRRRDVLHIALSACALALHFGSWIWSLSYTTVASSTILVTTTPIYAALVARVLDGERIGKRKGLAMALAMAGSAIVSIGDLGISGQALIGDALALLGALAMTAHLYLGRAVRRRLSTFAYVWPCYGLAALLLGLLSVATGQPLAGYDVQTWGALGLLALIPQAFGHSTVNWALAHVSPLFVTLSVLAEPVFATVMAFFVLSEIPPAAALVGGPLALLGIYMASREERRASVAAAARRASVTGTALDAGVVDVSEENG